VRWFTSSGARQRTGFAAPIATANFDIIDFIELEKTSSRGHALAV
jgi:hypothetical protein